MEIRAVLRRSAWRTSSGSTRSKAINSRVRHRRTEPFEEPTGIYHRRMFHFGGNNVSICSSTCEEHPFESVIISLASATREYDLIAFTTEQPSNLHSSFVHRLPRRAASPVAARRITVWLLEDHPHRVDDFRRSGSAGIKIQVNTSVRSRHGSYTLSAHTVRRSILSEPTRILLAGRSVRRNQWEDSTRFTEPREVRWFFQLSIPEKIPLG